jgi:small subunit ribosomal protein S16
MAVHVRLRRIGKNPKRRVHFRVTVFDERRGRDSRFLEELGYYSPVSGNIKLKKERLEYWVKNGAQLSPTVKSVMKKYEKEAKNAAGTGS